ncbi:CU044_5270 family protein [Actinomadura oligospora]|uniref:CU044_5270 family protein n=1 Tax=Actinomadura oligospora TaxID=111804 RepID=UPI0004B2FE6F|nr:CU044_5270 family protein [Actinomadura oligospora]
MDELGMIVALLDEEPSAHGEQDGRRKLVFEATGSPRRRRREVIRPRFALFGGFGLAGAAAAVAGAVLLSSGTTPRAPDSSQASGSRLMLAAAESADREPSLPSGRYWEVQRQRGGTLVEAGKEYAFVQQEGDYDAGPKKDAWITKRMVSKRYVRNSTAQGARSSEWDSFKWSKAMLAPGTLFQTPLLGTPDKRSAPLRADLRSLPSEPGALKAALDRLTPKEWTGENATGLLFSNAALILAGPVGPRTRGAAYRLLAQDPNVRVVGTVKDALGRTGTAFALRNRTGNPAYRNIQGQIVVDTRTGRLLGTQAVLVRPGGPGSAGHKVGDIVDYDAIRSYGWTNTVPDYPAPNGR